jgi:hypothetical protein
VGLVSTFLPFKKRKADTLLLLCSSFEQRCLGFASHLMSRAAGYRAETVLVLTYDDREDSSVRARVGRFLPDLRKLAASLSVSGRPETQNIAPFGLIEGAEFFERLFATLPQEASVVVDISTMTRLHLLYMLEAAAQSARIASLRLAYTRARYGRYDTLSWGGEEPVILPGFGRPRRGEKERSRLLLFCGLEPDRCYSIWRRFGQEMCSKVLIDSGEEDLDRCSERAERLNSYSSESEVVRLPAFQPDAVASYIESEYRNASDANIYLYLAPMTTKWEVIAVWEFFRRAKATPGAAVVYSAPGRLNASGHTRDEPGECLVATVYG